MLSAQEKEQQYPQGYFRNPLDIPISLAGNFGELRPNHFHTGLDLKTDQKEDLVVRAAADGFVSRIAISHSGYGNCLYISHPNGYTTVYAHLNNFSESIQAYLKQQQYAQQKWAVDIEIPDSILFVKKGMLVAYSGNTGGSAAPHLHFEIRKTGTDTVYNPLLFGFKIADNKAPNVYHLAIYNADLSIYNQVPTIMAIRKLPNGKYNIPEVIEVPFPKVKLGIITTDFADNQPNTLGIYHTKMWVNDTLQLSYRFDQLRFSTNRCINAFADYKSDKNLGKWFQGLYKLPGNQLEIYTFYNSFDGWINVSNRNTKVDLTFLDYNQNSTSLRFQFINKLAIVPKNDSCNTFKTWKANVSQSISDYGMFFHLEKDALYDDVCANVQTQYIKGAFSVQLQLHNPSVPLHSYQKLGLKLLYPIPFAWRTKLILEHQIAATLLPGQAKQSAIPATFENGYAVAKIRTLGHYKIGIDTIAPEINILDKPEILTKGKTIRFSVNEKQTSIQSVMVTMNEKWICFARKGNVFSYEIDEQAPIGNVVLLISATDLNMNTQQKKINITVQ